MGFLELNNAISEINNLLDELKRTLVNTSKKKKSVNFKTEK